MQLPTVFLKENVGFHVDGGDVSNMPLEIKIRHIDEKGGKEKKKSYLTSKGKECQIELTDYLSLYPM